MRTAHSLAKELLAGPDLPIWHFDPSRVGLDEECDTSLSVPEVQENDPLEGLGEEWTAEFKSRGYIGKFLTICGETAEEGEAAEPPAKPDIVATSCITQPPIDCPDPAAWLAAIRSIDSGKIEAMLLQFQRDRKPLTLDSFKTEATELRKQLQQHKICPPASAVSMTPGTALIAAERNRQIEVEEFTSENDDRAIKEELALAATCYAMPDIFRLRLDNGITPLVCDVWPWSDLWWKPSPDRMRDLQKAGALIAAEIDRLLRLKTPHESRD